MSSSQIYSATYSNVPVFEFVTAEGPIMRRKSDSWINATHILKIAKFPKARRTRILEKDVQNGIHDKVQGGYGKFQGTYVPLDIGARIAQNFGVYDILQPIFDFQYVEGESDTPPPAPKHNHASASNIARRQLSSSKVKREPHTNTNSPPGSAKRMGTESTAENGDPQRAAKKPKRVALHARGKPPLAASHTAPIPSAGPSLGTFSSRQDSFSGAKLPPLVRQDTERDALSIMASNMNVRQADLEAASDDEDRRNLRRNSSKHDYRESDDDEFMSGKELFGSRASFIKSQNFLNSQRGFQGAPESAHRLLSLNGSIGGDAAGAAAHQGDDAESADYFNTLLNYLMEDGGSASSGNTKPGTFNLPEKVLNPPHPLQKININRPVDDDGNTIFHWACSMANVAMIEFLLSIFSNFISSEVKNFNGETPLMFLVQFRNSYQSANFPVILDMLFDSVLSVDKLGRTVLHHVALACDFSKFDNISRSESDEGFKTRKERFANYYFDVVFSKIVEFPDYQLSQGDEKRSLEDKKEVVYKFVNHQDNHGNTAFHIAAHNMSKKCIKTFIRYHKFIDLSLRNNVNFSVEDYLASHNYVLRLENDDGSASHRGENGLVSQSLFPMEHTQSFDSQLQKTRMAVNFQNESINLVTEKLGELSYSIHQELKQKDDKLYSLYKYFRIIGLEKFKSQKAVLQLFNLHYLVEDIAKDYGVSDDRAEEDQSSEIVTLDGSRGKVIQEEISRLMSDSTFQHIDTEEKLYKALLRYAFAREKATETQLNTLVKESTPNDLGADSVLALAIRLSEQALKRKKLAYELYEQESKVPLFATQRDEYKENAKVNESDGTDTSADSASARNVEKRSVFAISDYPPTDKLYKYCKLVALSCGMSMTEVENSIDLLEQSLAKNTNGG